MAVVLGKITLLFEDSRNGWSETYWRGGDSNLPALLDVAKIFAVARAQLLGKGSRWTYARVSDVDPHLTKAQRRISAAYVVPPGQGMSYVFNSDKYQADVATTAALFRIQDVNNRRYMRHFSGIPDVLVDTTQPGYFNSNDPFWVGALNAFSGVVNAGQIGFRYGTGNPPPDQWAIAKSNSIQFERAQKKNRGRKFFLQPGRRTS